MKALPFLLITISLLYGAAADAQDAGQIVRQAEKPFIGNKIYSVSEMTVYRSGSARPTQVVEGYTMDEGGRSYSLTLYLEPARMKGSAYLIIDNDLWVRFASTGRIRKLSSSAKKNSAGGTDFSYSDMGDSGQGIAKKYQATLENRNVVVAERRCFQIALIPRTGQEEDTYEKLVAYIDQENYRYLKIDYIQSGAVIKTLTFSDYRNADGRDYPFQMIMESHTQPSRTEVVTKRVEFDSTKVEEDMFTISYLQRIQ